MKLLGTASLGCNFTGSYQKENVVHFVKVITPQSHWRTTEYNS